MLALLAIALDIMPRGKLLYDKTKYDAAPASEGWPATRNHSLLE